MKVVGGGWGVRGGGDVLGVVSMCVCTKKAGASVHLFCYAFSSPPKVIRFPFCIFCCRPQGCAFIRMAGFVGQSEGACINNYSFLALQSYCSPRTTGSWSVQKYRIS